MNSKPLSPWQYFGLQLLYSVPVVGFVFLIIHSVGARNVNMRNFARSYWCVLAVVLIAVIVSSLLGYSATVLAWLQSLIK